MGVKQVQNNFFPLDADSFLRVCYKKEKHDLVTVHHKTKSFQMCSCFETAITLKH